MKNRRLFCTILTLALAASAVQASAQGTIYFANRDVTPFILAPVKDARNGQRLEGTSWIAKLYYTRGNFAPEATLGPAEPSTSFGSGGSAGLITPIIVQLPDVEGGIQVTVQMRVWNAAAGNSYEEAALNPFGVIGKSNPVYPVTGGAPVPGQPGAFTLPGELQGLQPFSVFPVPEPPVAALVLSGITAMVLSRHRKLKKN